MTGIVDPDTGEILTHANPQTLDEVNTRINVFIHHLSKVSKELVEQSRELQQVSTAYKTYHAALILQSEQGEAKRREADAECALYDTAASRLLPTESDLSIGALKDQLEMEVRILRDRSHDYRAAMNALQTVASNMRAELSALNAMPS